MSWKLFIDDERWPVTRGWVIARSTQEAIDNIKLRGMPNEIAFDHDLGLDDTAMKLVWWIVNSHYDGWSGDS